MSNAEIVWHGADRERPTMFKVIVRQGRVAQHHARLAEAEYLALLEVPSLVRPTVRATGPARDVMAELSA